MLAVTKAKNKRDTSHILLKAPSGVFFGFKENTMSDFGYKSRENLSTVNEGLIRVAFAVVQIPGFNHSIICGHRNEKNQTAAFEAGNSKTPWPDSNHNVLPSDALDFLPYPFDDYPQQGTETYFKELARWYAISAAYIAIGHNMGIELRGGFDWDRDGIYTDQTFDDIGHIEIIRR